MSETVAQLKVNVSAAITVNDGVIRALKTVEIVAIEAKDVGEVRKYVKDAIAMMEKEPAQQPAPAEPPATPPPSASQQPAPAKPEPPPHAASHATENKKK